MEQHEIAMYRSVRYVWYVVGVLEALLALRFALKLLGANAGTGFTQFIYSITSWLLAPFRSVFDAQTLGGNVFEWSTLLAMAMYFLLGWGIAKLIAMNRPMPSGEAHVELRKQDA